MFSIKSHTTLSVSRPAAGTLVRRAAAQDNNNTLCVAKIFRCAACNIVVSYHYNTYVCHFLSTFRDMILHSNNFGNVAYRSNTAFRRFFTHNTSTRRATGRNYRPRCIDQSGIDLHRGDDR